ncbi:MAG: S-layer homology domain-containing protein [Bacillota bacterium]
MRTIRRNKQWAGNICLVVFAALLFSMVFASVGAGAAQAAVTRVEVHGSTGGQVTLPHNAQGVEIKLQAATPADFAPVWAAIQVGNQVYKAVYLSDAVDRATYVATAVYELVYNVVYNTLFQARTPFQLAIWDGNNLLRSVSLTFEGPPPETQPGPGVGVAPPPPVLPGQPITATPTVVGGTATAVVDATAVNRQLQADPQATAVGILVPVTAGVTEVAVQLPAAAVNAVATAKRDLHIDTQFADFLLPSSLLAAPEIANQMAAGARLALKVQAVPPAQANALLAARPAGALPAGQVLDIALAVVNPAGVSTAIRTFAQRVWITLPFEAGRLGVAPAWSLGVYRLDEAANAWEFRGGKVDQAAGTVAAGLSAFSKFTVMAYHRTFADIRTHWGQKDIEVMASRHVARGVDQNRFEPDRSTTRAEFAALLLRSMGVQATRPARATFNDVAADKWYFAEVETARRVGLVIGYEDNTFRPEQRITRQEIAAMVNRAMGIAGKPVTLTDAEVNTLLARFADAANIAPWARHAAAAAVKAGIVKGRTATTLAPAANGTRAEGTVMLKRMLVELGEI